MITFIWLDLILYTPVNNFSVISGRVYLGRTSTKQGLMCLGQGHITVMTMRHEPQSLCLWSSTLAATEPLRSL